MNHLVVTGLHKSFGAVRALDGVDLQVAAGSTTALLGPSGCGKTTLLRIIAGFERPDAGSVVIGGEVVTVGGTSAARWVPPERRAIGYVAQEGALFPHLTIRQNVAFALGRKERRGDARITELMELVSLDLGILGRRPHELSGGQQQRVALARALATRPRLMLLDEPFAALDAGLRSATRDLVAAVLAKEGVTTVLVTHDQEEALSFADQVLVMRNGQVQQAGAPRDIYNGPKNLWTAGFLGDTVQLPGVASGSTVRCALGALQLEKACAAGDVTVMIRPEQIAVMPCDASHPCPRGVVAGLSYRGHDSLMTVKLADDPSLTVTCRALDHPGMPGVGTSVDLQVIGPVSAYSPE
ncbi:ABC transporter ATP-binding protein [Nakamurella antarctica]|uniref:ABC-type quaternary amine transporter n=1 Tax=Nakamurella antarctica TaxID=1902245 RepID=A0A3G8ZPR9_9ACTN|nr:ABC transporter ATP-binding protein [Nakamurella antarctica]AZI58787.1 ABC transporter ATP-binding protein [Nakamurella antarctica]